MRQARRSLCFGACALLVAGCGGGGSSQATASPSSAPAPSASVPAAGEVSFFSGWEDGITGANLWRSVQAVAADRLQAVASPVRAGSAALRVEVRPGDDPLHPGAPDNERAEVAVMNKAGQPLYETESSGTQYFAFSVRLEAPWTPPQPLAAGYTWGSVFQLHGPDSLKASPAVSLDATDRFRLIIHSGDLEQPGNPMLHKAYILSDASLNAGGWVDFVIRIVFDKGPAGAVTVWRRNEGARDFTQVLDLSGISTLQYASSQGGVGNHYWKHGFYRPKQSSVVNVLWLDGLTRASSFDTAVQSAFGAL